MKKNRLFVLGLVTVFVALVSLTFVSSTWAKYTTTASGSDSARVAYWGFTETELDLGSLFIANYTDVIGKNGSEAADVIAPGTTSSVEVTFKHADAKAPEVDYHLQFGLDFTGSNGDLISNLDAHPGFTWTLTKNGGPTQSFDTSAELAAAVAALSDDYDANVAHTEVFTIGWVWTFSEGPEADKWDTTLGNAAIEPGRNIFVKLTAVATQIGS